MAQYLMLLCHHYFKGDCNNGTIITAPKMTCIDEQRDLCKGQPSPDDVEELDKVCRSCPDGFFELLSPEDPTCPVCQGDLWDLSENIVKESWIDDEASSILIYHFKCPKCGKSVYSKTNLWA
jgi:hypothetical protein